MVFGMVFGMVWDAWGQGGGGGGCCLSGRCACAGSLKLDRLRVPDDA